MIAVGAAGSIGEDAEAPEAAVAERGVRLMLAQLVDVDVEARQRGARGVEEPQVDEAVKQHLPEQVFDGEIVDALAGLVVRPLAGLQPAIDNPVTQRDRGRQIPVVRSRGLGRLAVGIGKPLHDRRAKRGNVGALCRMREDF